jgi:hypothetical protein
MSGALHFDFTDTRRYTLADDYFMVVANEGRRYATDLMEQGLRFANVVTPFEFRGI